MSYQRFSLFLLLLLFPFFCIGQTIAEKKAALEKGAGGGDLSKEMEQFLARINIEIREQQAILREVYAEVQELWALGAEESAYQELLEEINTVRSNILVLETSWREMAAENNQDADYDLWHQPDTTVGDLIIDFGSQDYVYLSTPEIATVPISVNSNIPIPRANWPQMMEAILVQNGIGFKQINPYLRQLYFLSEDRSSINLITNNPADLDAFPPDTRVCFMVTPEPADVRRVWFFLEKFVNPNSTDLQMIGRDILIIAPIIEVRELLKLYAFIESNSGDREYKVITLRKVPSQEIAALLGTIFDQFIQEPAAEKGGETLVNPEAAQKDRGYRGSNGLKVIPLADRAQAIFLIGTPDEIRKAEEIVYQIESQIGEATEKTIFTYTTKHTDSEELATILERVYAMMIETRAGLDKKEECDECSNNQQSVDMSSLTFENNVPPPIQEQFTDGFYQEGNYIVNPAPVTFPKKEIKKTNPNKNRKNFIVDPKTGSIIMVVEVAALPKLRELIKKIDVPKKMVQIEVLLFEKRVTRDTNFGLNLLRLGDCASNTDYTCLSFNDTVNNAVRGITDFFFSRKERTGIAAYDIAYKFLVSRDDISINTCPSVTTLNQTTARISIVEEISIDTGVFFVGTTGGSDPKTQFTRTQYGAVIEVTPTIHMLNEEATWSISQEEPNYITLETSINFDSIDPTTNPNRPDVARRNIKNVVRIADGQTAIIGGLRSKDTTDTRDSIPYLGEIPGLGKLFSYTTMNDRSREMFICITPKIISDPAEEMEKMKCWEASRRPGDVPAFLCRLERARECAKELCFQGYLQMVFGRHPERCYTHPWGEYDGR